MPVPVSFRWQVTQRFRGRSRSRDARLSTKDLPAAANLPNIPDDIIWEVAKHIDSLAIILDLCLVSRHTHALLAPKLYSCIELDGTTQCRVTLAALIQRPEVLPYVKRLVVHPNHRPWDAQAHEEEQDESEISDLVISLASTGKLRALCDFVWDGMEIPRDNLWLVLRNSCPNLRHVGCSVGFKTLQADSELFRFDDLLGFVLTSHTCNFRSHRAAHQATQEQSDLPEGLWTMLRERCPNLEKLILNGYQDHLWSIGRVSEGRWPRLRKLSLGFHPGGINNYPPFRRFLVGHPRLQDLALTGLRFEPWDSFDGSSFSDVPPITAYTGFWPIHRSTVPYPVYDSIRSVTAYHTTWVPSSWMMTTIFPTLHRKLPSLTSISLSVDFGSRVGATDLDFFHSLFSSCPSLGHLEIASSSHFDMHVFATAIQQAPSLTTFDIVKVSRITDEDMTKSAVRLLRNRPELLRFSITHVCPWRRSEEYFTRQRGVYETLPGFGDIPSVMVARESTHKRGQLCTRRYRIELPWLEGNSKP